MMTTPEARSQSLLEALPYIQKYRGHTFVIKYGGSAMEDPSIVERFLRDIVFLEAVGINPVLVHGGGKAISSRMKEAGLQPRFVDGLRVTDEAAIRIVEETLDTVINPGIVRTIEEFGGKARGFSGKDVFVARKLLPTPGGEDIGFVGAAEGVSCAAVRETIHDEVVPVISPIGADASGTVLNINADIAAAALAAQLQATKLIYVTDVRGIMRDPAERDSLIPSVTAAQVETLIKEKVVAGGMIPKVRSAIEALGSGVGKIHLVGGHIPHCLVLEIFSDAGIGTEIIP